MKEPSPPAAPAARPIPASLDLVLGEKALRAPAPAPHAGNGRARREVALERIEALRARKGAPGKERLDLTGLCLVEADLSSLDLSGADLSGADLSRANLEGAKLVGADLRDAVLFRTRLERADLTGADLSRANLQEASARFASFGRACLAGASLTMANLGGATLTAADLTGADLKLCRLENVRALDVCLRDADLSKAKMQNAKLVDSDVDGAKLDGADLRGAVLRGVRSYESASWIGIDARDIDFTGAHLCRRFVLDQNYLHEFRRQGRWSEVAYRMWWLTSDCGRSLTRWMACTGLLVVLFAGLYVTVDVDYGDHRTALSPLYFSVVTMTTLGFGDVVPSSIEAQAIGAGGSPCSRLAACRWASM
jgi:uncharacterized protein YjbI with pentapeptide repeats